MTKFADGGSSKMLWNMSAAPDMMKKNNNKIVYFLHIFS